MASDGIFTPFGNLLKHVIEVMECVIQHEQYSMVVIQVMLMVWIQLNLPLVDQVSFGSDIARKRSKSVVSVQIPTVD